MVDRYTITADKASLEKSFSATLENGFLPRYNAAPTQAMPIITHDRPDQFQLFTWGLISNLSNNKKLSPRLFNLPLEAAIDKPSLQKTLINRRCIIPATGFYLWKPIAKKKLTPYYVTSNNQQPLWMAGVWEEKDEFDESAANSYMLITTSAQPSLAGYQEDMPLLLNENSRQLWLSTSASLEDISGLLNESAYPDLSIHAVSPLIANIEVDSEELIKPSRPSDQFGNYTLFN